MNDSGVGVHSLSDALGKHLHYVAGTAFEMESLGMSSTLVSVLRTPEYI